MPKDDAGFNTGICSPDDEGCECETVDLVDVGSALRKEVFRCFVVEKIGMR